MRKLRFLSLFLGVFLAIFSVAQTSQAQEIAGPQFIFPVEDQTLDYEGSYLFAIETLDDAQAYLWEFIQNDQRIWQELKFGNDRSATEYGIGIGSDLHSRFTVGDVRVSVRALIGDTWTESNEITIHLVSNQTTPPTPTAPTFSPLDEACTPTVVTFDNEEEAYEIIRGSLSETDNHGLSIVEETYPYYPSEADVLHMGKSVDVRIPTRCGNLQTIAFDLNYDREPSAIYISLEVLNHLGRVIWSYEETIDPGSNQWGSYSYRADVPDTGAVRVYAGIGAPLQGDRLGHVWLDNLILTYYGQRSTP
ncbi:MAG: hypothetical protein H7Y09_14065 [Chitinophagaceae bacterium]|nr:hypothetical protein [Anaerolineae bacterium]